ncbi:DUF1620-domain-containing protein [Artomyces pyxidatus]|uniref:DUF1620-domain-containing protein n=1 Tax=Artomyces pyxidatus TaxID=48021 RepID=A0ACB8SWA1_9AGAM|nr:DUF1620-domain-containing protein [Artomyces pyxidatus]
MRWLASIILSSLWATSVFALHEAEAGVVDWHKALIGVPQVDSISTAPTFEMRPGRPPTEGLLLTATGSNVLAALHAGNGSVAWRYIYEPADNIVYYQRHQEVVTSLSGPGGATLRTFDFTTGHLLSEKRLHHPQTGLLLEPNDLGVSIASTPDTPDLFILTSAHILRRVDRSGKTKWTWTSPDQTSLVVYTKLIATDSTIYVVGLAKSFSSYTLHIAAVSTTTGELLSSAHIPSSIGGGSSDIITLAAQTDQSLPPRVAWLEGGSIHSIPLVPQLNEKPASSKGATYEKIIDVGLHKKGYFVALQSDGSSRVFRQDVEKSGLKVTWEFADSAKSDRNTESFYIGGVDKDDRPYVGRVFWSLSLMKGSAHVYAPKLADGKGLVSGFTFSFDTNTHGIISHAALHPAYVKDLDVLPYLALTTSTGAVQMWQGDRLQWSREEGLTRIQVAEMVELPEPQSTASHTGEESFVERLARQLQDTRDFPQYLVHFVKRFTTGSYASASSRAAPIDPDASTPLSRDPFGFRKVIVATTDLGKVYGIDSSNGEILWSRVFGLGWAAQIGGQVIPVKLFVTRTVPDGGEPQVVVVTQRRAENSLVDTVLFHIDALTGEDAMGASLPGDVLQGHDIISGPLISAHLLPGDHKTVVLLDEFRQVYLYPNDPSNVKAFTKAVPKLNVPLRTGTAGQRQLTGHQFALGAGIENRAQAYSTWAASFAPSEEILSIVPRPDGPVASLGKVIGSRATLYKYLNPHMFAVLTSAPKACNIYVVDGAKGSIIYHALLPAAHGTCDIHATFVENWLVYVYWDEEYQGVGQAKGRRVVSVELYEGNAPDEKIKSSELSSYSNKSLEVTAYAKSFVLSHGITAITATSTKYGITSKDIIVANDNGQIQSFPRTMLNPRRPKNKPTTEEQEEWLFQYDPIIPDDTRRVLSHNYQASLCPLIGFVHALSSPLQVANVKQIVTSPALLESTSLVFAYGLDLFFTRVAPSSTFDVLSENFNKVQLVFTIVGLAVAIMFTKPMVRKKRLRERWYQ